MSKIDNSGKAIGAVVGGSVLSMGTGISTQDRIDIYNVLAFVQNDTRDVVEKGLLVGDWFDYYQNKLRFYGFAARRLELHVPRGEADQSLAMSAVQTLEKHDPHAASLAQRSLDYLKQDQMAESLFSRSSAQGDHRHFQVIPCVAAGPGRVDVLVYHRSVQFAYEELSFFLNTRSIQSTTLERRLEVFTFNTRFYDAFRAKIAASLARGLKQSLIEFDLAPTQEG